jgi:hypothetical protein
MKAAALGRRLAGLALLLAFGSVGATAHGVSATWSDELDLAPGVVRPDGNVWRNYPPGEANGALNGLVTRAEGGTWFIDALGSNNEGSVPWNGQTSSKGPLQNMSSMTFQFRFKLGSDPATDPDNVWEPFTELDGLVPAYIDNNIFTLEQETFGTIKWGWVFGYEARPDSSFPINPTERGVSMQFFGKGNTEFLYHVTPWDALPLANNQWYVGRVVADWRGGNNPNSTISIFLGTDETNLQLLKREDLQDQDYTQSLAASSSPYFGDYNFTVIKHGKQAAVEFDYFRAYNGVLAPTPPLDAASAPAGPGDFNGDGAVNAADYVVWQGAFPSTLKGGDLLAWQRNFGKTAAAAALSSVPEPAAGLLTLAGWAAFAGLRRKR